ncbi:MAG: hypothetical protein NXI18_07365 [Alphaproteobacteria bacterium]|nr:hypothetical protein [Alphaproteobacteria bacterium]
MGSDTDTPEWPTDCTRCFGLCCIALAHQPSAGFPAVKPRDTACRHLDADFRCTVFDRLEASGFTVCRPYDCFGAGPVVADRMRAEWAPWTPAMVATAHHHLDGFRDLARLRMLIVALRREGSDDAHAVADRLEPAAEAFRRTGRVEIDADTAQFMRWHEALISAILTPLEEADTAGSLDEEERHERS